MARYSDGEARLGSKRALDKYRAKTDPQRVRQILEDKRSLMAERYQAQAAIMRLVYSAVCGVTDAAGVPAWQRMWYNCFGREVYALWRRLHGSHMSDELMVLRLKWMVRGLAPELLMQVEEAVIAVLQGVSLPE